MAQFTLAGFRGWTAERERSKEATSVTQVAKDRSVSVPENCGRGNKDNNNLGRGTNRRWIFLSVRLKSASITREEGRECKHIWTQEGSEFVF